MSMNMEEIKERSEKAFEAMEEVTELSGDEALEVLEDIVDSACDVPSLTTEIYLLKMQLRRAKRSADNFAADAAYWHRRYTYTLGLL